MLERIRETGGFIAEQLADGGGGVLDPHDQVSVVRYIMHGERERGIGATALRNRYIFSIFANVRGPQRVEEVVAGDRRQALITVFLKNANFVDVGRLQEKIREYARTHLAPAGVGRRRRNPRSTNGCARRWRSPGRRSWSTPWWLPSISA